MVGSFGEVNDGKPSIAEADVFVGVVADAVWSAVGNGFVHAPDEVLVVPVKADDTAHGVVFGRKVFKCCEEARVVSCRG